MYKMERLTRKVEAEKDIHKDIKKQISKNKKIQRDIKEQINSQIKKCHVLLNELN